MTTLAFPDTAGQPTDGSFTYEANGVIYSWTGDYWAANNAQGFDHRYVNVDGDQMTGDLTVPSLNGGQLAGFRNQLINSDFRIWQRGQTFTDEGFTADRWQILGSGNVTSVSRISQGTSPGSFNDALPFTRAAQLVLTGTGFFSQYVEIDFDQDARFRNNQLITLSWWTTATQVADNARISFTDTSANLNTSSNFTQTDFSLLETVAGWNHYKATFRCDQSPLASNRAVRVALLFSAGTSSVSGIQLEPGPVATPFEYRPIGTELALCQRYYQRPGELRASLRSSNTSDRHVIWGRPVEMRVAPTETATFSNGTNVSFDSTAATAIIYAQAGTATSITRTFDYAADAEL